MVLLGWYELEWFFVVAPGVEPGAEGGGCGAAGVEGSVGEAGAEEDGEVREARKEVVADFFPEDGGGASEVESSKGRGGVGESRDAVGREAPEELEIELLELASATVGPGEVREGGVRQEVAAAKGEALRRRRGSDSSGGVVALEPLEARGREEANADVGDPRERQVQVSQGRQGPQGHEVLVSKRLAAPREAKRRQEGEKTLEEREQRRLAPPGR
mmetsp:Transcript_32264/g.102877  ORF Transcript_32264/g.102877 Transcript_32264/m.102877 type:complete len:216 (+) Transcript_32264:276-923(+)